MGPSASCICMYLLPLGNAARATRTVSSGIGEPGDARRDIAHPLDRHDYRTQTTRVTSLSYIQCTRLCPRMAPVGRLGEFASRVNVGFGPTSRELRGSACRSGRRGSLVTLLPPGLV